MGWFDSRKRSSQIRGWDNEGSIGTDKRILWIGDDEKIKWNLWFKTKNRGYDLNRAR